MTWGRQHQDPAHLLFAPSPSTTLDGSGSSSHLRHWISTSTPTGTRRLRWVSVAASVTIRGDQNHNTVLGVSPCASSADIKRAYRLLALKYYPDVCKDSKAGEVSKSIHLAYITISNEATRSKYDEELKFQDDASRPWRGSRRYNSDYDGLRIYKWADLRRKMQRVYEEFEEEPADEVGGTFIEVLKSAFLSLFLMQTVGFQLSLAFTSLMALVDKKLDAGYKVGYILARGGILLTLCLSFASWVCSKTSSSVVVAMWVGSNLARYAPLPQGAVLTLLYMFIKLQVPPQIPAASHVKKNPEAVLNHLQRRLALD
ncbi:DnaJ domain [Dillenia turbinata]|uniref:DnaJ domain n=1 Tax=Dillenia turbinata TaxID=194707 RepID=A0AAN8VW36_9MAGN